MKSADRDSAYLWDMADAARRLTRLLHGMDFDTFIADDRTKLAIERLLENIGEAASHVSRKARQQMPVIPWDKIIGIRNILAHQYGSIDHRRIWETATKGVPEPIELLKPHVELDE